MLKWLLFIGVLIAGISSARITFRKAGLLAQFLSDVADIHV